MEIPSEILYRNGIAMMVTNAGIASVISLKSILATEVSIRYPTMIRAGAVAKDGIARKIGDNSSDNPKRIAATREVSPVRPPSATPEALSTKCSNCGSTAYSTYCSSDCVREKSALDTWQLAFFVQHICLGSNTDQCSQCIKHIYKQECKHDDYEIQ